MDLVRLTDHQLLETWWLRFQASFVFFEAAQYFNKAH
jgi:hypothetical protein